MITDKKTLFFSVESRNIETLTDIFSRFVLPGSIFYTDGWPPYIQVCKNLNFEYIIINCKYHPKNPVTGVHKTALFFIL